MADSSTQTQTHIPSPPSSPSVPIKSKSLFTHYFFSKSLIIILVLLVFHYFPSQVPDMFKDTTLINKLWDLIYLFVIGILVSYGLFSRKADSLHSYDNNNNNNIVGNESYLSGISQISSIFEDGNLYGFDEKPWVEGKKLKQCFVGESFVVINDEKFVLDQLSSGKKTVRQNLGSKSLDSAVGKSVVQDSDSDSDWFKESKKGKFRGLMPVKLEEKFKESGNDSDSDSGSGFGLDSGVRFKRRSKSMRLEKHDDMFTGEGDEGGVFDFEGVKTQPVRFGMPSKIRNLSEKEESKGVEAVEVGHRYKKSYVNGEKSFVESKLQGSNIGGYSEMNHQIKKSRLSAMDTVKDYDGALDGSLEEIVDDFGKIKADDDGAFDLKNDKEFVRSKSQSSSVGASSETLKSMLRKEEKADVSSSIPKPATNVNNYKRGKSVRTNRSKEQVLESKVNMFHIQTDDDKVEAQSKSGTDEMDVKADEWSDAEPHSGEVDRKAEEFIAKFKEQIRLQKVASARKLNLL